ncbi:glycosyltransferase family 4 protein [Paucidesulfovibrio longus]|uniref:glycosyltransferase family 4 protein n=1 Tax=Paucidesulfovibrio longus TaxID=889 RepID=UPI0003B621F1|nr:glycosyltransferase family 4 protein [Paucidesulfovibrio longus]
MTNTPDNPRGPRSLFLAPNRYPPNRVDVSILFCREMAARGHDIDFLLQSAPDESRFRVVELVPGPGRVLLGPTDNGTGFIHRLRKRCLDFCNDCRVLWLPFRNRYDFIQVRDKFLSGLLGLLAARLTRTRFFFWMSFPMPDEDLEKVRQGTARYPLLYALRGRFNGFLLYRVLLRAADHVFVQSEQMRRDVAARGIAPEKCTPVPMGVADDMVPAEPDQGEADEECVAYLGSLSRVRRMDFLVRSFALVAAKRPGARLLVVGEGDSPDDRESLVGLARELGVAERCEFTGFLPPSEAWKRLNRALVCLSPFYPAPILNSTSPTKLVEYMALARPVVATDHPEQRLVIEQSGAGLCTPYDEAAFAEAMLRLLADPGEARRMGLRGREYVLANRTYSSIADRVDAVYRRLLGLPPRTRAREAAA